MESDTEASRWLMQFVAGIEEIKISETGTYFEKQYAWKITVIERKNSILSALPRLLIESVTIAGILIFCAGRLIIKGDDAEMIP